MPVSVEKDTVETAFLLEPRSQERVSLTSSPDAWWPPRHIRVIEPSGPLVDHQQVPHPATAHVVFGLDREVLDAAGLGFLLEEPESAVVVGAAYRRLDRDGLLEAEWWGDDLPPLQVTLTPLGRTVLCARGGR